ncbi:nuclear transport factor 2 family protein [Nocardia sp. CDC159]|uniref:Nuclear transport factor 2 family protein n=1 Tax=Nocardia pulmonis TaxID=2951408 RepID=A0A9X2E9V8_9NOCA|nr:MULTISPECIES: nuclear transport factor 2 family protein [Nocardia]MCM6776376.1 nuclear transport factor 2 family protein [Nocardia pulmonis]MCM6788800.1 nuclear transport factor 2 family protein [Nocardia sp. CDC159]
MATNTAFADTVTRFREAFAARDVETMVGLLAPDFELYSPVESKPYRGRAAAGTVFTTLIDTFDHYHYMGELSGVTWDSGPATVRALLFRALVDNSPTHGISLLQLDDDDRIAVITIMSRPGSAVAALEQVRTRIQPRLPRKL